MVTIHWFRKSSRLLVVAILGMQGCVGKKSDNDVNYDRNFNISTIAAYENLVPVVVIGSGPAGLGAALYGARDNVRTVVVEGPNPGGLLMYTTAVENWPGSKSILGPDIIKQLREQVEAAGAEFMPDMVEKVDVSRWPYQVKLMSGKTLNALSIVVATGASPRKLGVPGEEEYWGRGVTVCAVCDAHFFKNMDVVVVGGGDSAIEEAMQLANHAQSVTILVRKDTMRAAASMQKRLEDHPSIKVIYNVHVQQVIGDGNQVTAVEVYDSKAEKAYKLPTNGVFLAVGHTPNSQIFEGVVDIDANGYIKIMGKTHKTSRLGISAAGEVEDHRYRQAAASFGDGTKAALDCLEFLRRIGFTRIIAAQLNKRAAHGNDQADQLLAITTYKELMGQFKDFEGPVVLNFHSNDCPTCPQLMNAAQAVAKEMPNARFLRVDAQQGIDLVEKFYVYKVPCLLVFKEGKLLARYNKVMNKLELREFVEQFMEQNSL